MLSASKKTVEHYLNPFVKYFASVNPNTLTLLGSIPPLLFFVCMIAHLYVFALISLIGNGFDLIDGMVARKYHKVTKFGGFLDSTVDRVADFLIITAFGFAYIVRWEIVMPLLLFAYLTSYVRSWGELADPNVSFAIGLIERPERLVLVFLALLCYTLFPTAKLFGFNVAETILIVIAFLSLFTVTQGLLTRINICS